MASASSDSQLASLPKNQCLFLAYRFFFYAGDSEEPRHIHAERDDKIASFGLTL
jgi:hypothetical protein